MTNQKPMLITIFGGSGFIGRHVVQKLAAQGHRLRIAVRRPDLAIHLQPLGNVGQIMPVQANVRFPKSLKSACQGADIVINLTGIIAETRTQSFSAVHEFGARAIANAAKSAGAKQLIHMSAIGANKNSSSEYAKSKFAGEQEALKNFKNCVILSPSIVFGPEDLFFNKFADLARFSPFLPLIGGGNTRFQPVYVGDVANAVVQLLGNNNFAGKTIELGGPQSYSFKELMTFVLKTTERKRLLVPVPWSIAKILGSVLSIMPAPLLTRDQVLMLEDDNIVSNKAKIEGRTLEGLDIDPESIETRVPSYLFRYRKFGQFTETGSSGI